MMGRMMGSAPSAASSEMSVLRALARLLDPDAGPEIARIAASLPREDVRHAIEGLHECIALITALTRLKQPSRQRSRTCSAARLPSPSARHDWSSAKPRSAKR